MKKKLSILVILSLAFNITYAKEVSPSVLPKGQKVTDIKDNDSKLKENQKKKKTVFLINSKKAKLGLTALGSVVLSASAYKLYDWFSESKVPDNHKDPNDDKKDDNEKDNNQKDDNKKDDNEKDSLPNFTEIFKNGLGSDKVLWNKYARLGNPDGRCWLCSILYSIFRPELKNIYFKYADSSIDEAIDFLDDNSISSQESELFVLCDKDTNNGCFGKPQKEFSDYLKINAHIDYDYIYNNFFANDKIYFNFNNTHIKDIEVGQRKYFIDKFIFYFTNLRKLYAIGFKARCQIFRAMINNPGITIDFCSDGYGIQIDQLLDEILKLPFIFREYDPANKNYNDYNSKLQQIKSMITGTNHKFLHNLSIDETEINAEPVHELKHDDSFCLNRMINNYNEATIENSTFYNFPVDYNIVQKNGEYILNKTLSPYQTEQGVKINKKYFITTIGCENKLGGGHAFCIYPRYKIDENGNIKYIGFVFLSCTSSIYKDYFFPTKTGDFREIKEASCWLFGSYYRAQSSYAQLLTEEDLKENIQYYTVDDDIIKKFNL